jgi:hypothetical protein
VTKPDIEGLINATLDLVAKARTEVAAPWIGGQSPSVKHRFSTQLFSLSNAGALISH